MQIAAPTSNQILIASFISVGVATVAFPGTWSEFFGQRIGAVPITQVIGNTGLTMLATLGASVVLANAARYVRTP
jgi:hypothetical protein